MNVDDIVALRRGGGREGRIAGTSVHDGLRWRVAWLNTNIVTYEAAAELRVVRSATPQPIVERRPPARATLCDVRRARRRA